MADKNSIALRAKILVHLKEFGPYSRDELARKFSLSVTAMSYHLTQMRKQEIVYSKNHKWHVGKDEKVKVKKVKVEKPATVIEGPPSLKLMLYAARQAIDDAIAVVDEVEARISGG